MWIFEVVTRHLNMSVLYILTSLWVLRMPNAGRNSNFQGFLCKKPKKARILQQISAKNSFFAFHQNAGRLFYSQKKQHVSYLLR